MPYPRSKRKLHAFGGFRLLQGCLPNIKHQDEAGAPLIYAAISAECSDDRHSIFSEQALS